MAGGVTIHDAKNVSVRSLAIAAARRSEAKNSRAAGDAENADKNAGTRVDAGVVGVAAARIIRISRTKSAENSRGRRNPAARGARPGGEAQIG